MKKLKLKSCPFCSGRGEWLPGRNNDYFIHCINCAAMTLEADTKEGAACYWNNRSEENFAEWILLLWDREKERRKFWNICVPGIDWALRTVYRKLTHRKMPRRFYARLN